MPSLLRSILFVPIFIHISVQYTLYPYFCVDINIIIYKLFFFREPLGASSLSREIWVATDLCR